jgi:beta-phosphoglucomutase family hydrolase
MTSEAPTPEIPAAIRACLFDLDGVLTRTAAVHAAAWKTTFDEFLATRPRGTDQPPRPFSLPDDYTLYVDGKLREDGVRSFLASRHITLPEGTPADPASTDSISSLAARKNDAFLELLATTGVDVYESSVRFVEVVRDADIATAVVSASRNCQAVLEAAHIEHLFETRVDGRVAEQRQLRGKPAPDMFLAAAADLCVEPANASVFEDAIAGVQAARRGNFGWVVGVDRAGHADALREHGADVVVGDLADLLGPR